MQPIDPEDPRRPNVQIAASILELPLERTATQDGSAFGAALLAGVHAGGFADVAEAVATCVRVSDRVEPEPAPCSGMVCAMCSTSTAPD